MTIVWFIILALFVLFYVIGISPLKKGSFKKKPQKQPDRWTFKLERDWVKIKPEDKDTTLVMRFHYYLGGEAKMHDISGVNFEDKNYDEKVMKKRVEAEDRIFRLNQALIMNEVNSE